MSKKQVKALPRRERVYPAAARVLSTNFPAGFDQFDGKCFVPLEDFRKLENKYLRLFKRYTRKGK